MEKRKNSVWKKYLKIWNFFVVSAVSSGLWGDFCVYPIRSCIKLPIFCCGRPAICKGIYEENGRRGCNYICGSSSSSRLLCLGTFYRPRPRKENPKLGLEKRISSFLLEIPKKKYRFRLFFALNGWFLVVFLVFRLVKSAAQRHPQSAKNIKNQKKIKNKMPSASFTSSRSYVRRSRRKGGNRIALPSRTSSGKTLNK